MPESNDRSRTAELEALRREDGVAESGASPQAYRDETGVPRSVGGDEDAQYGKTPPFPSNVQRWFSADTLPVGDYVFTDPIDVRQRRVLSVWIEFEADGGDNAQLSIVPQIFNDFAGQTGQFWNTTVLDGAITVLDLSGTVLGLSDVGSRTFHAAELRTGVIADGTTARVMLPFDVSPVSRFRLGIGALTASGRLALGYSFSE